MIVCASCQLEGVSRLRRSNYAIPLPSVDHCGEFCLALWRIDSASEAYTDAEFASLRCSNGSL